MRRSRDVIVYLTEPGGNVSVAVQLAFFINMKNLSTAITAWDPPSMNFFHMGNRHLRHSRISFGNCLKCSNLATKGPGHLPFGLFPYRQSN